MGAGTAPANPGPAPANPGHFLHTPGGGVWGWGVGVGGGGGVGGWGWGVGVGGGGGGWGGGGARQPKIFIALLDFLECFNFLIFYFFSAHAFEGWLPGNSHFRGV